MREPTPLAFRDPYGAVRRGIVDDEDLEPFLREV